MRYVGVRAETLYRQHRPRTSVHHELHRVSLRQHRVFLGRVVGRVEGQIWTVKRIRFHLRHHESVEVLSIPLHSHLRKRISVPLEMRVQWRKGEIHISGCVPLRGHLRRHVLLENSQGVEHSISEYKNILWPIRHFSILLLRVALPFWAEEIHSDTCYVWKINDSHRVSGLRFSLTLSRSVSLWRRSTPIKGHGLVPSVHLNP